MRAIISFCVCVTLYPAVAEPSNSRNDAAVDLELDIVGHISPKCEIQLPNRAIRVLLNDQPGTEQVGFRLDCNQQMSVVMTSQNGGLEHASHGRGESFDGFANFLPYSATFQVDADGALPVTATSNAMLGGAGGAIGVVPHKAAGSLALAWNPEQPLVGGTFEDVIEIRVTGAGESEIPR